MRHKFLITSVFIPGLLLLSACGKDGNKPNSGGDLYIANPEKMMNLAGSPWSEAKLGLENKKGYWYTDFTGNSQNIPFHAAVSLPATEETDRSISYNISFNTSLGVETVGSVQSGTDTILSFEQARALMLEYYNRSLPLAGDTSFTGGYYIEPGGLGSGQQKSSVAGVVDMLNRGVAADAYGLEVTGTEGSFNLSVSKYMSGVKYYFTCQTF